MRLFQLITFGQPYLSYFAANHPPPPPTATFESRMHSLLDDRYGNSHLLDPVDRRDPSAFLAIADDDIAQGAWAAEQGMPGDTSQEDIVLAQIEAHRADVVYNISPLLYDSRFLRRLPGSVKKSLCWRAAPVGNADLSAYDLCVCNFQGLLDEWTRRGWKAAWFEPGHDPVASEYADNADRPIDIAFVGGYSRHHATRNRLLQRIARLSSKYTVRLHFSVGKSAKIVNALGPLRHLFPHLALEGALRAAALQPLYGRAMYELFGSSRIVINAAIDMASEFRGNMRCWEALGCGALMLSDEGVYPPGLRYGNDFETYQDSDDALRKIDRILGNYADWRPMAAQGHETIATRFSKATQWSAFVKLVAAL
jgi:hypothetical protein